MNPHFLFNSLSSLQYLIHNLDNDKAEAYLNDLSYLIRSLLENSDKQTIPLSSELAMLNKYIELERLRYKNQFDFDIDVANDLEVDDLEIPSMLIQPFVENAIVHAFNGVTRKGQIAIKLCMKDNLLYCAVQDNGIGRENSVALKNQNTKHTSIAVDDTKNRMNILNRMMQRNIQLIVTDLYNENQQPAGTRVELYIPIKHPF
jgi:LytS/YehU family sensor histidine kinase